MGASEARHALAERTLVVDLIDRIVAACPQRRPASDDERRAANMIAAELSKLSVDLEVERHHFRFTDSIYANLALHFGLGSLGTIVSGLNPALGLALHLTAGGSYLAENTRKAYILRRLFEFKPSQNVVATLKSHGEPELRIVFLAHLDAAFTGLMFDPRIVRRAAASPLPKGLRFLRRGLAVATGSQFALAGFDLLRMVFGPLTLPLRPLEYALSLPAFLIFAASIQVVLRNEIVPGANDDLSGVAALPILAARLAEKIPDGVELVFVATGCEEAGLGGADALARDRSDSWDRARTVVLALDGFSNGELCIFRREGDVTGQRAPAWLVRTAERVAATEPRFRGVRGHDIPVGGTDAGAFLARGFDAMGLGCLDAELGAPLHYHLPSDTPDNLDPDKILGCIDFTELLVEELVRARLG